MDLEVIWEIESIDLVYLGICWKEVAETLFL